MTKNTYMENTCPALPYFLLAKHNHEESSCPATMTTGTKPLETAVLVFHIFFTIFPILFSIAFTTVAWRKIHFSNDTWRFLLDFFIIVIPIILNVTVCNQFVEVVCVIMAILVFLVFKKDKITTFVEKSNVVRLGHQPIALTLLRSTINIITAVCILAIDFTSFPKTFRKSRTYGVGLMDTGIGLFVFSMGAVSKPPKGRNDFVKLPKMVGPALLLGLARTIVIQGIGYQQDDTEYGTHMNAFFTLGLTKLLGAIVSAVVVSDFQLLVLGTLITATHECVLLFGLADFIMDRKVTRRTLFLANREGICSLPGFIGIYLISMYIARVLFSESAPTVEQYSKKVKKLAIATVCTWMILFICIATVRISRRVANFGYITWTLSIALSMLLFYIILFDYAFYERLECKETKVSPLMEATNRNGLVFFLVANILTGAVNMFLHPNDRSAPSSLLILSVYMLLSSSFVYILLRMKIKIA